MITQTEYITFRTLLKAKKRYRLAQLLKARPVPREVKL
jgi:hypothetical protein